MTARAEWVVVFDCDGTLFPKETPLFNAITAALPPAGQQEMKVLFDQYCGRALAGRLNKSDQLAWIRGDIEIFLRYGLTEQLATAALKKLELRDGVRDVLQSLRRQGIPTAVVSYGVEQFIRIALAANGAERLFTTINATRLTFDPSGRYTGFLPDSVVLPSNKGRWSRDFALHCGALPQKLLAIGDSGADRQLGYLKGNRLAICKDANQAVALFPLMGHVVVTEDFEPVADWLRSKTGLPI